MNLAQQQSKMVAAIQSKSCSTAQRGTSSADDISIYQQSFMANACRALAITFATTESFLGKEKFNLLVKEYFADTPKTSYDWGESGETFSKFLFTKNIQHREIISALAALDWSIHLAERAKNEANEQSSFEQLNDVDAYQLTLRFAAGFKVLELSYPVDQIIDDVTKASQQRANFGLDDIASLLNEYHSGHYYFLVWRPLFKAYYKSIPVEEFNWLNLFYQAVLDQQPISIGSALDQLDDKSFSIVDWLPIAINDELVKSISLSLPKKPPSN